MTKILLSSFCILCMSSMVAQVSFTNEDGLIGNYGVYHTVAVDMNNDNLDDYVRVTENGIGIDYQNGDGTFTSIYRSMSIQNAPNWSIAAGDLDENGYNDLVLGNGQRVSFLMANNDGSNYVENTHPEFIFSQRSNMVDIDNDGDLDAFVCHDVDLSHPYRNDGNGNMTLDQTLIETIDLPGNYASLWVDYDNDGDTDMYLSKCRGGSSPGDPERDNAMYTNNGDGTYTENAQSINLRDNAQSWVTMFEDFDNDGDFDAFTVNHDFQNRFYENNGSGVFTDIIQTTGIDPDDLGAWENQTADFNNDGYIDILSEMNRELYINNGDMTFTGIDLPFDEGAIADLNNDGFLDVAHSGNLWINNGNSNNHVIITLKGIQSNSNGIGARISITGDWGTQMREIRSGQGFSHMNSLNAHFGLGSATAIETIRIDWPSGVVDVIENPDVNTQHVFTEGDNQLSTDDFDLSGIQIYPNPTADILNFSMKDMVETSVAVIDTNGRVVMNTEISENNSIDVSELRSGVYFVQFDIEGRTVHYKFAKN
ncbi:MAG: T9SS type A sorting domain-containing protein [Flavobacteriaceae bacterium]|nr:T9SS type A sorting domain-containing protein [Flavobacteriaceae bacterium]